MAEYILGKPSELKKDVLILFVKSDIDFEIEDINPQNRLGVPSFLLKINCLYIEDNYNHINIKAFEENLVSALDGLHSFGDDTFNIGYFDNFKVSYELGTSIFLISRKFNMDKFTIYLKSIEDRKKIKELDNAINVFKDNLEFRKVSASIFGKGILEIAQENIIKRTYNLQEDFSGKTLLIVDTHNQHHRNWHGMPDMRNVDDEPTSVIKAFTTLIKGLHKFKADYTLFASEGKNGIRFDIDPNYKGTRDPISDSLKFQINECDKLTKKMGFQHISEEGFEADDIIGSYTRAFEKLGGKVIIITSDKDMYQLISDNVSVYDPFKKKYITEDIWLEKFKVSPDKIIYSLAIQGDDSDNVPGIKGIGVTGAAKLIDQFGDIEKIIEGAESLKKSKMKEYLLAGFDNLRMSYELVRLYDFLAVDVTWSDFESPTYNPFFLVQKELDRFAINV